MKLLHSFTKSFCLMMVAVLLIIGSLVISPASASAETYTVKLGSDKGMLAFEPKKLTVKPGDTIEWVVNKVPPHNVVFSKTPTGDKDLAASLSHQKLELALKSNFTTTIPADAPVGEYEFYCTPHRGAGMVGKLTVAS